MRELSILDRRIPPWAMTELQARCCPICGDGEQPAMCRRPDGLVVRLCTSCATYFVSPAPTADDLAKFYATYDLTHGCDELSAAELHVLLDATPPYDDLRIRELSSIMDLSRSRILDVGFGRAGLLYQLKRLGADVFGVDLDENAHKHARSLGIEQTILGDVSSLDASFQFDVVILHDVAEHPLDPLALLRRCANLLEPGGVLQMWTPNGESISNDVDPVMLRVDLEHMQYFTPGTCVRLADMLGLRLVHLETVGRFNHPAVHGKELARSNTTGRRSTSIRRATKQVVKSIPGVSSLLKVRRAVLKGLKGDDAGELNVDNRCGNYHLLAMFSKPHR